MKRLYKRVDEQTREAFFQFRARFPPTMLEVDGAPWKYLAVGDGRASLLFLHGMAGAYDIWWQQIEALKHDNRVVSVTNPNLGRLEELGRGLTAILDHEGIEEAHVIGSSLGGYLAQFYLAIAPSRVAGTVFGNTFPPNDTIRRLTGWIAPLFPQAPAWLVALISRLTTQLVLYPASGRSELLRAYLLESSYGAMDKQAFITRYRCAVERFQAPDVEALKTPVMIVESDNDPLISRRLREMLKVTYPSAAVRTMGRVGHFPYLSHPGRYNVLLADFLRDIQAISPSSV